MTWTPIWALPNIKLDKPVESEFFALAPSDDERVRGLTRQYPEFRKFIGKFTDVHGRRIYPALILQHTDAPTEIKTIDAVASFRDLLVASTVTKAWSYNLFFNNNRGRPDISTYFWVYPWMIDRNFENAIAHTPTTISLHDASAINAQSSPELIPINVSREDFDEPLLQALLYRWSERYLNPNPTWKNIALFRSLNIANQACQYPSNTDATIFDYGRIISLWVSAFETLVHPGANGKATLGKVYELLESVPWLDKQCGYRRFSTRLNRAKARRNIACWIYNQVYDCRNAFLHGNPLDVSNFILPRSGRPLINVAPSLYRLGLTSFLNLSSIVTPPPISNPEEYGKYLSELFSFNQPQEYAERAVLLALVSTEEQERRTQEGIARSRIRTAGIRDGLDQTDK